MADIQIEYIVKVPKDKDATKRTARDVAQKEIEQAIIAYGAMTLRHIFLEIAENKSKGMETDTGDLYKVMEGMASDTAEFLIDELKRTGVRLTLER